MNKIVYILSLLLLLLVSCKEDEVVNAEMQGGTFISIPEFVMANPTRTSLMYNESTKGMDFEWISGKDILGIYTTNDYTENPSKKVVPGTATPFGYVTTGEQTQANNRKIIKINPVNMDYRMTSAYGYTSYYPYDNTKIAKPETEAPMPFNEYPISFRDQEQRKNVDIRLYYDYIDGFTTDYTPYMNSERAAASHLAQFDYMISTEKKPDENNNLTLPFEHLGSVVRFFLRTDKIDNKKFRFHTIRVVAPKPVFYKDALVNMSNCDEEPISALKHLTPVGAPEKVLKLSLTDSNIPSSFETLYKSTDVPNTTYSRYLIAYMMLYPVNLGDGDSKMLEDTDVINLYLEGDEVTIDPETSEEVLTPVYFKATNAGGLVHWNFEAGKLYQWTCTGMHDDKEPIELQAIKVETWKEEVLNNTENGNGTHAW